MNKNLKVLLVKTDTREFEKLINNGWQVLHAFAHPAGALLILKKV